MTYPSSPSPPFPLPFVAHPPLQPHCSHGAFCLALQLERRHEDLVNEVRNLEGELADYNLAMDKLRTNVDPSEILSYLEVNVGLLRSPTVLVWFAVDLMSDFLNLERFV